jgi:hypothetical protein
MREQKPVLDKKSKKNSVDKKGREVGGDLNESLCPVSILTFQYMLDNDKEN